jgi:hypothetical protein
MAKCAGRRNVYDAYSDYVVFWYRHQTKISRGVLKGAARRFDKRTA